MKSRFAFALILLTWLFLSVPPAHAQDGGSAWGEVVNSDGSINYGGMTDNGVVTKPESFMPTVPIFGQIDAEYHSYTTESGNQVLMPSASTLFFMAMDGSSALYTNPSMGTAGLSAASAGDGTSTVGAAFVGKAFGLLFGSTDASQFGGSNASQDFFPDLISGQQNLWELGPSGLGNLLGSFLSTSLQDGNLYTYMILMPPDACGSTAGCAALPAVPETPPPPTDEPPPAFDPGKMECPAPQVIPGQISFGGSKTAPEYPLVVGQDPDKRGVDFSFHASVAPTRYITYRLIVEYGCDPGPCRPGERREVVGYHCAAQTQVFEECIESASGRISLSQTSREWILDELAIRYPEAYLHDPDMNVSSSGGCEWSDSPGNVPVADPGYWNVYARGSTSGTPVSGPRSFGGKVDEFQAWLKEIAIIK